MASERQARLELTERVGRELVRRGLNSQASEARRYYAAVRAGREPDRWSHEMIVEWARLLRVSPHEHDYAVRPQMWRECCDRPKTYTAAIFPEGSKHVCESCRSVWLELDAS